MAIYSETGTLRRVLVHRPGPEVEQMTPSRATELLYNDIVPVDAVRREHDRLRAVLEGTAETIEVVEVLQRVAVAPDGRERIARELAFGSETVAEALCRRWEPLSPKRIVEECVLGVPAEYGRLEPYMHGSRFLTPPLPNLYFMRDASFVVYDRAYRSIMASTVRRAESALVSLALEELGVTIDREHAGRTTGPIEGGDVLVYSNDLLLIGVGSRTGARAVDALVASVTADREEGLTVLAVELPEDRATIHLDMIVTVLAPRRMLVYAPLFEGARAARVYRMEVPAASSAETMWRIDEFSDLRRALDSCGVEVDRIPCGGIDPVVREREQWFSGCNSVALAPDQVVVFGNNRATLDALAAAGFEIREDERKTRISNRSGGAIAWAIDGLELARGGGGPRCMTLPIDRENTFGESDT